MEEMTFDLYTKYTLTLHDLLKQDPTILDIFSLDTPSHTNTFKRMFVSVWDIYEIGGETIEMFKIYITNKFNEFKDYYNELINIYETKVNFLDGVKTTNLSEHIDLPNKVQDKEYVSSKDRNTLTGNEDVTDLKIKGMKALRNIYRDFAKEFKPCFITLYD